jgi:transposase
MKKLSTKMSLRKDVPAKLLAALVHEGCSQRAIVHKLLAKGIHASRSTVQRRVKLLGLMKEPFTKETLQKRLGHSDRFKRHLARLVRLHGGVSTTKVFRELNNEGYDMSRRTMLRRLQSVDSLCFKSARQRPRLTAAQQAQRLSWARTTSAQQIDWSKIYFADEKTWQCDGPVRRQKMWHDKRDAAPVLARRGALSKSLAVWGAFSIDRAPDLVSVSTHINSVEYCATMQAGLLPRWSTRRHVLYHDRHTAHHSAQTNKWMCDHRMQATLFPPKGADLNPMENLWGILSRRVYAETKTYDSAQSLHAAIKAAWLAIKADRALRAKLAYSMPSRLEQVIERKGLFADY